jgi:hypothetical protein
MKNIAKRAPESACSEYSHSFSFLFLYFPAGLSTVGPTWIEYQVCHFGSKEDDKED